MPHLGKPYPYPIHRDVALWRPSADHRLARNYKLQYRITPFATGTCEFTARNQTSLDVEYLYTDVVCRWRWDQPCPSAYYFFLEWMFKDKVEDFTWRWSLWQGATLINRTVEYSNPGNDSSPQGPSGPGWGQAGTLTKIVTVTVPALAAPWPT